MGRSYLEKRIIKAGINLCKERVERGGNPITADDLKKIKVATMSPILRGLYYLIGTFFVVFGIWAQNELEIMVVSIVPVLMGVGNIGYAVYGNSKSVESLESDVDIMDLSADIVSQFVAEMDKDRT